MCGGDGGRFFARDCISRSHIPSIPQHTVDRTFSETECTKSKEILGGTIKKTEIVLIYATVRARRRRRGTAGTRIFFAKCDWMGEWALRV